MTDKDFDAFLDGFSPSTFELPFTANTLCEEARSIALGLLGRRSDSEIKVVLKKHMTTAVAHAKDTQVHISGELADQFLNAFNMPADPNFMLDALARAGIDESADTEYAAMVKDSLENNTDIMAEGFGAIMLLHLYQMKINENNALKESSDYQTIAQKLNDSVTAIHQMLLLTKTIEAGSEYIAGKIARKEGAKKGGQAKSKKLQKLRKVVLREAEINFRDKTAAAAARSIVNSYGVNNPIFLDDNGNELLVDPVDRITAWIRADRKKTIKINVCLGT